MGKARQMVSGLYGPPPGGGGIVRALAWGTRRTERNMRSVDLEEQQGQPDMVADGPLLGERRLKDSRDASTPREGDLWPPSSAVMH